MKGYLSDIMREGRPSSRGDTRFPTAVHSAARISTLMNFWQSFNRSEKNNFVLVAFVSTRKYSFYQVDKVDPT